MPHPQLDGFLALPASGTGPGVLVLHAWWGLNETIDDQFSPNQSSSSFLTNIIHWITF